MDRDWSLCFWFKNE